MTSVWVVMAGEYSGTYVAGVFATEELANEYIDKACSDGCVEEEPLRDTPPRLIKNWLAMRDGTVQSRTEWGWEIAGGCFATKEEAQTVATRRYEEDAPYRERLAAARAKAEREMRSKYDTSAKHYQQAVDLGYDPHRTTLDPLSYINLALLYQERDEPLPAHLWVTGGAKPEQAV